MSKYVDGARKVLEARKDRSQRERGITLYALEILDTIEEAEQWRHANGLAPYIFVTRMTFNEAALNNADNWAHYSECGQPLWANWDIIERLYPPSMRDRVYRKCERGEYDALYDQARALAKAEARAWAAYNRQLPKRLDYDEIGAWARACMPAECIGHHGVSEDGVMHDLYMKDTPESRTLIKRLPRGWNEALLSSFYSDGAKWYDLPFLWCGFKSVEV